MQLLSHRSSHHVKTVTACGIKQTQLQHTNGSWQMSQGQEPVQFELKVKGTFTK